jgi:flagellar protein FlgJ
MMQVTGVSSGTASAALSTTNDKASLKKAAHQFEAVFLRQMIGAMRSASLGEGLFDSSATDQFRDMADSKTADSMADKGVLGIAEMLLKQFDGRVGATPSPTKPDGPAPNAISPDKTA